MSTITTAQEAWAIRLRDGHKSPATAARKLGGERVNHAAGYSYIFADGSTLIVGKKGEARCA